MYDLRAIRIREDEGGKAEEERSQETADPTQLELTMIHRSPRRPAAGTAESRYAPRSCLTPIEV
jgi:hypothetical protein